MLEQTTVTTSPPDRLRVLLITEDDPIYVREFFDVFLPRFDRSRIEVVAVVVSRAFHEPLIRTARRVIRFFGPLDFLRLLPRYFFAKVFRHDIGSIARRHGLTVLRPDSVNSAAFLTEVGDMKLDMIVSVAAPEIFKSALLSVPSVGCLNIHSGELPAYRGMMPTFWQMLEGRDHVTITIHEMVPKLDAGGIISAITFPLLTCDSLDRVIRGTKRAGAEKMLDVISSIADTRRMPEVHPLDMSKARLFKFPQPADVSRFRGRGHRMI